MIFIADRDRIILKLAPVFCRARRFVERLGVARSQLGFI